MATWHFQPLNSHVCTLFGPAQVDLLRPSLYSLNRRASFAKYHYFEANKLLEQILAGKGPSQIFLSFMGADNSAELPFSQTIDDSMANVIACIHSMVAISDALAHVIYYSLGMNLSPHTKIRADKINLWSVREKSPSEKINALLSQLLESSKYRHLSALNNHSKHRGVTLLDYNLNPDTPDPFLNAMIFDEFEYKGHVYPSISVTSILPKEFERQSKLLVDIGNGLNDELLTRS